MSSSKYCVCVDKIGYLQQGLTWDCQNQWW